MPEKTNKDAPDQEKQEEYKFEEKVCSPEFGKEGCKNPAEDAQDSTESPKK